MSIEKKNLTNNDDLSKGMTYVNKKLKRKKVQELKPVTKTKIDLNQILDELPEIIGFIFICLGLFLINIVGFSIEKYLIRKSHIDNECTDGLEICLEKHKQKIFEETGYIEESKIYYCNECNVKDQQYDY